MPSTDPLPTPAQRRRELFLLALEQTDSRQRSAFLAAACKGDPALREHVEALLEEHARLGDFMDAPAMATPSPPSAPTVEPEAKSVETQTRIGLEKIGDRIGRYKLLQEIGEGGCGTVYMAEQEEPVRRRVALKVIKPGMDTRTVIARFEAERQALALMDHANIAKIFDAGTTHSGRPFFVMELVRGIRITEYCDQNQLTTDERLDLFVRVCQAIQHAHQKGIIHRDIKPSNILVTLHDGVPVPKVIDFGIAKATERRLTDKTIFTAFEQFVGTPAYTSPEQAEMSGLDIDTRTDIYSLGVLLYEMLTGKTPFDARELAESGLEAMRRTIREIEPPRPSTRLSNMAETELTTTAKHRRSEPARLAGRLRGDLDWMVMKAIEKDRRRRYATAHEFALDVQRHLANEPVIARPPSNLYRFRKFVRRNRVAAAVVGAFTLALCVGLALSTWQFLEKNRAYQRLLEAETEQRRLRQEAQRAQATEAQLRQQAEVQELAARRKAYAADLNLAQHALAVNNLGRATDILVAQEPHSGQADLRGWEWRYLWQNCQSDALFTLCQASNAISALTVSADGKWVALAESDSGGVAVWDLRSRLEINRFLGGEGRTHLAFSPAAPVLAFTHSERQPGSPPRNLVRLWDAPSRRLIGELQLDGTCRTLQFSPDGRTLLTGRGDSGLTLWDVSSQQRLRTIDTVKVPRFSGIVQVNRDFTLAAVTSPGGRLRLVELSTGQELWNVAAAEENVMALAFSPDGRTLATGAGLVESAIRLWDLADGREIGRLEGHRGWVSALMFWPDGRTLASASGDQTLRLWDVAQRRPLQALRGHKQEVWSLALMPDLTTLVSGGKDGAVCVWDTGHPRSERTRLVLPASVRSWQFAPDSQSIWTLDSAGVVASWSGTDFQNRQTILETLATSFQSVFSRDGRWLATSPTNSAVRIWDLSRQAHQCDLVTKGGRLFPMTFVPGTSRLLGRTFPEGGFEEWDVATAQVAKSWPVRLRAGFRGQTALSSDGAWWLVVDDDGAGQILPRAEGAAQPIDWSLKNIQQVTFSPDDQLVAAVSTLGTGGIWERRSGRLRTRLHGFLQGMHSVAFSPDGKRLAIGSTGAEAVKIWDVEGQQELITLAGQGSMFLHISFSPDGTVLAANNSQGLLHLWRTPPSPPTR